MQVISEAKILYENEIIFQMRSVLCTIVHEPQIARSAVK